MTERREGIHPPQSDLPDDLRLPEGPRLAPHDPARAIREALAAWDEWIAEELAIACSAAERDRLHRLRYRLGTARVLAAEDGS